MSIRNSTFLTAALALLLNPASPYDDAAALAYFAPDDPATARSNWTDYVKVYDDPEDDTFGTFDGAREIDLITMGRRFTGDGIKTLVAAARSDEKVRRAFWRMGRAAAYPESGIESPEFMAHVNGFFLSVLLASVSGQLFVKVPADEKDGYKFNSPALRLKERESKSAEDKRAPLWQWVLDAAANDIRDPFLLAVGKRYSEAIENYSKLGLQDPTDSERAAGSHPNGLLYALTVNKQHQIGVGDELSKGPAAAVKCEADGVSADIIWNTEKDGSPSVQGISFALIANPNRRPGRKQQVEALVSAGLLVLAKPVDGGKTSETPPTEAAAPSGE